MPEHGALSMSGAAQADSSPQAPLGNGKGAASNTRNML